MWPACVDALTPFPVALRSEPPADLAEAFRRCGWSDAPDSLPVRLVALLGTCTTAMYADCPNMPEWHAEHAEEDEDYLEQTGRYYWCDFDLTGRDGSLTRLRMAFNEGDADCNDGTWGVVWDRDTAATVADLTSVGDCEGRVAVMARGIAYVPHGLPVPTDNESLDSCRLPFTLVYAADAEIEKLVGVAMGWCFSHRQAI